MARFSEKRIQNLGYSELTPDPFFSPDHYYPNAENELEAAFSTGSRNIMLDRAEHKCEITGWGHMPLEAMHLNHDHSDKALYNLPSNGLMGASIVHLAHHVFFINEPEKIGLTRAGNNWAIDQIANRVVNWHVRKGIWQPMSDEDERDILKTNVDALLPLWRDFYRRLQQSLVLKEA